MSRRRSVKSRSRRLTEVKPSLDKSLKAYAIAAGAASVGLAGLVQLAEAKIVYTPTHQTFTDTGMLTIDFNADGINDFTIHGGFHTTFARNTGGPFPSGGYVSVRPSQAVNQVVFATSAQGGKFAQALAQGAVIGSSAKFGGYRSMAYCSGTGGVILGKRGPWFHETNRYLGLKFVVNGQIHYGWARLTVRLTGTRVEGCQFKTVLSGYAYETIANKSIMAGQTSGTAEEASAMNMVPDSTQARAGLGLLALGALGLTVWRRQEENNRE